MTSKERISCLLNKQPTDRIPKFEHFWGDTYREYSLTGKIPENQSCEDYFDLDIRECWAFNLTIDLDFKDELICEDEDTVTTKNGNGAIMRNHKKHNTTPEHVDFTIKTREDWDKVKHMLVPEERRIDFTTYRNTKKYCEENGIFFTWSGINVFECMHPVCGHETLLMNMIIDPDWIKEMAETYANLLVELQKILFEKEGYPDAIYYYEDMGYKQSPFMSPAMYDEFIKPSHVYTIKYAKEHGLPVIMHSCGFVEPLLPGMVDAGIDCLQAIEVKAGMDVLRINREFGDRICLMGGLDVRALYSNDKALIDEELEKKLPELIKNNNFCLHSDHSIPKTVDIDTLEYFYIKANEIFKREKGK